MLNAMSPEQNEKLARGHLANVGTKMSPLPTDSFDEIKWTLSKKGLFGLEKNHTSFCLGGGQ